ncbi:MAG: aldolase, partial [Candidatus Omnitrophica bacterium]|nr:aldolase [Candidatus Omnitrophota bacterium]
DQTEEQFIYKSRKKALGPFKKEIINIKSELKAGIIAEVEKEFGFLFEKLKIKDTKNLVSKYIKPKAVKPNIQEESVSVEMDGEGDD